MPVLLEGTAVVIRNDALDRCLDGGASGFYSIAPNAMSYGDDDLSQASFMSPRDAEMFRDKLLLMGLSDEVGSPDVVLVDAHHQTVSPACDWLQLMEYKGSLIASLVGNDSDVVVAPESWDPEGGPSLQHMSSEEVRDRLEFVRREDRVDVYRDKESGQLFYSARLHETPQELFSKAADVVLKNMRLPGHPPPSEAAQSQLREAIGTLQQLVNQREDAWRIWFLLGKAWHAVDRSPRAIVSFEQALAVAEESEAVIYKELAGVLLESGETVRACQIGEKAVALRPDDIELLGNLSIAYLLDGRPSAAKKTVDHALSIDSDDSTNRFIHSKVAEVIAGRVPCPRTLAELEGRTVQSKSRRLKPPPPQGHGWIGKVMRRLSKQG